MPSRRAFLLQSAAVLGLASRAVATPAAGPSCSFPIALSADSLVRTIGKEEEQLPMLALPRVAREDFEVDSIVLTSAQFPEVSPEYLASLRGEARQRQVDLVALRVDGVGELGAASGPQAAAILANHRAWIDIAAAIDCPAVAVVWRGYPVTVWRRPDELAVFIRNSIPTFQKLCGYADTKNINVLIANDQGPSAYPESLASLVQGVNHPRFRVMLDTRGFARGIDRYEGIDHLMPHTDVVMVRCYDFDDLTGNDTTVDYARVMEIVCKKHSFQGPIAIHYAGSRFSELDGIRATRDLLLHFHELPQVVTESKEDKA